MNLLVFTDLDGTLLDHDTYSHAPADATLARLREAGATVVLSSSKTAAEMRALRETLHLGDCPFVSENGSAVFIPAGPLTADDEDETILLGASYADVRAALIAARDAVGVSARGFGDMTAREVATLTGLTTTEAAAAKARDASEPVVFDGDDEAFAEFERFLEARGLRTTRGGRFVHVMGDTDKGRPVALLRARFSDAKGATPTTVGLGDSDNDLPMLMAVDIPVVVRRAHAPPLRIDRADHMLTDAPGPRGWAIAMAEVLARLE